MEFVFGFAMSDLIEGKPKCLDSSPRLGKFLKPNLVVLPSPGSS